MGNGCSGESTERIDNLTDISTHQQTQPHAGREKRTDHMKGKHYKRDQNTDDFNRNRHGERTAPDRMLNEYDIFYNDLKGKKKKSHEKCRQVISSLFERISEGNRYIEKIQKDVEKIQEDKNQLQYALSQREKEIDHLKRDKSSLESSISKDKEQLKKLQTDHREMKDTISQRDQEIHTLGGEKSTLQFRLKELQNDNSKYERSIALQQQQIQNLETEKSELLTRLSAIASAKLTDGNANIADLSDENRPTKLAEQFSELYDNEWTDAFAYLTKDNNDDDNTIMFTQRKNRSEKEACTFLLKNFFDIYSNCKKAADEETEQLKMSLQAFNGGQPPPRELSKQLKDMRKKNYGNSSDTTMKLALDSLPFNKNDLNSREVRSFLEKCVLLCRRMVVQDPPVFIDTSIKQKGESFNGNLFKPYTKSGPFIDFVVWPTLYLCEGGNILSKGVAQATNMSAKEIQETDLATKETRAASKEVQDEDKGKLSTIPSKPPRAVGEPENKGSSSTAIDAKSAGQKIPVSIEITRDMTPHTFKNVTPNKLSQKSIVVNQSLKTHEKHQSIYDKSDKNITKHPELGIIYSPTNSPVTSADAKEEDAAQITRMSVMERVKTVDNKKQSDKDLLNAPQKPQRNDGNFNRKRTGDERLTEIGKEIQNITSKMPEKVQSRRSVQIPYYKGSNSGTTIINVSDQSTRIGNH